MVEKMASESPTESRACAVGRRELVVLGDDPQTLPLPDVGELVVGRARDDADVVLDHPSISRRHALLTLTAERVSVTDLRSKNGTRIAGAPLPPGVATEMPSGVVLEVGELALVLQPARPSRARLGPRPPSAPSERGEAMERVHRIVSRIAPDEVSVLLLGETGVGKERLAEALHRGSPRAGGPLVRLNCAAVGETLFESELFGHEKGAFTGAATSKPGLLEAARGGTVFLDEIGELPLALQSKLLRAIEQRVVRRVGGRADVPIDVRFVSATNRDLEAESARGTFRSDLFFRLSGFVVRVPPLRARIDELPQLGAAILSAAAAERRIAAPSLSTGALAALCAHPWPGNVRELRNVLVQALLLASGGTIEASDLPLEEMRARAQSLGAESEPGAGESPRGHASGSRAEPELRARIEAALRESAGNQTEAARRLGISRRTLLHRLDELGFARPRKR
jgi:two-component system response regulator AtoC